MSLVPETTESVVYEYIGDVTSLRKATEQAIGFLDSYQKHIDRISADGGFGKSTKASKSFQSALKSVTKDITAMQKKLKDVSDVKLFSGSDVQKQIADSLGSMSQVYAKLQSSAGLTTKEVQALTAQLKSSRQSLQASGSGVDALVAKEVKFQQTLANTRAKVTQFRDSLDSIRTRVYSVFDPLVTILNSLRNPFARIVQTVQSFKDKAVDSFSRVSQLASTVSSAFRRVSNAEDDASDAASRSTRVHSGLATVLNKMRSLFVKESQAIETEDDKLDDKNKTLNSSTKNHRSLGSIILNLVGIFNRESRSILNMNTHLGGLAKSSNLARNALRGLTGVQLGRWLAESIKQSISYVENLNLFAVATGEAYESSLQFVNSMAELYGMDPSNIMRYAGNFYQLADAISMPDKASAALSLGLTKATNDIASLFNVDIETVFENLSSGMQGMSRAVRKYGMDIRTTTLQQTALSLGLTEQVENMSEANRQGLRFITMMQQANNASGDFARTIETPANQLRIFKEQITQLGRAIGNFFIGPLTTAIAYINGFVMALRTILQFIGSILGVINSAFGGSGSKSTEKTLDNVAGGIGGVGGAAKEATKELKKMLAPFDELTVLQEPEVDTGGAGGGGGGGLGDLGTLDPAILKAIEEMQWKLDDVKMKAVEVRDAILAFLGFKVEDGTILSWDASVLEENLINKFPKWTKTIQAVFDNWSDIVDGFKAVFKSMGSVVQAVWNNITNFIEKFVNDDSASSFISDLGANLQSLASWIDNNADSIANFVTAFGLFRTLSTVIPIVSGILSGLQGLSGVLSSIGGVIAGVTAPMLAWAAVIGIVVAALTDLLINNEDFRSKVGAAWESLVQLVQDLWSSILEPIVKSVIDTAKSIYNDTLKPIVEQIATLLLTLWSDILQPVLSWLINALGPSISDIVDTILEVVKWLFDNIGGFISGLLQVLQGVIDFIAGVFTGDWDRAWQGIVDIFAGVFNAVGSVVVAVMNAVITVINGAISLVYNAIVSVINLVLGVVNTIGSALGFTLELGIDAQAPQIPYIQAPKVAMAQGGVVSGPTNALIGEGRYDEAVVPLGNSPQMREFADSVADRVNSGEQIRLLRDQNELLRQILAKTGTYLDGREISKTVTKYQKMESRSRGV